MTREDYMSVLIRLSWTWSYKERDNMKHEGKQRSDYLAALTKDL